MTDLDVTADRWFSRDQDSSCSTPMAAGLSAARWRERKETSARAGWFSPTPDDASTTVHAGRRLLRPRPKTPSDGPILRKFSASGPGRLSIGKAGPFRAWPATPQQIRESD